MIDTRSLSVFKRLRIDSINNFRPSVRQNNGNTIQQHDVLINHKLNVPKISLVYSRFEWFSNGQGGNPRVSVNVKVEDQKLERDNLALKNSMDLGYSVRVIYGHPRVNGENTERNLGQLELTQLVNANHIRENVNKTTKSTMQTKFVMEYDVSQGKEIPIPVINEIDDERPPTFHIYY
ncbi:hypothetical protein MTR67_013424 [Solanum verrucosum]|uniref:YDG domain-containing protein n=1 Tax=Solanum verrucosum TaxID=315347 RepID=A0AAF0QAF4_SOLVR|nr:hypothetical protein MTR67_013424 [Solanum verrucosum]